MAEVPDLGEELAETVAVTRAPEAAAEPVGIEDIARHFAQGKAVEKRVGSVVAALARLGHLSRWRAARRWRCAAGRKGLRISRAGGLKAH